MEVIEEVKLEDDETTFEQLQDRINKTIELLRTVKEESMEGKEQEPILMKTGMGNFKFESGQRYWSEYALPNVSMRMSTKSC